MTDPDGTPPFAEGRFLDDAFDVLGDSRRRLVLYHLRERDRATVDELSELVAERRDARGETAGDAPAETGDGDDHRRAHAELYHVHLPKLADLGLVSVDDDGRVSLEPLPEPLGHMVDEARELESGRPDETRERESNRSDETRDDEPKA